MRVEVEKTVSIPVPMPRVADYGHEDMKVGESFCRPYSQRQRVYNANWRAHKKYGYRFQTQRRVEDGQVVIRVWRVA